MCVLTLGIPGASRGVHLGLSGSMFPYHAAFGEQWKEQKDGSSVSSGPAEGPRSPLDLLTVARKEDTASSLRTGRLGEPE